MPASRRELSWLPGFPATNCLRSDDDLLRRGEGGTDRDGAV